MVDDTRLLIDRLRSPDDTNKRPEVDATYRRFMEGLRVACDRSRDDGN